MTKVFTITEGLENMGAIKTGGQGSVYKGRRIGEIISAIKILPTPIHSESEEDKNYVTFQNEVKKLKKVNEDPNPNVVKILSSGVTDSGNFPFIEMEFIEGPDLEELLKPPHERLFTIKEALKVAEQLSCALAHCHKADVRHGDIKSNNVKYNINTGNYILLDFGLAMMSDEERRTSLRHAGAIEFMAPEQNDGQMLFQTDVYSFGVIIFELLAGTVPFPLNDHSETGRNTVMMNHLETLPPDLIQLRLQSMPLTWSEEKKQQEMNVPEWVTSLVYKCLEKKPENRFASGLELHEYVWQNTVRIENKSLVSDTRIISLENEITKLKAEKEQLQRELLKYDDNGSIDKKNALLNNVSTPGTPVVTQAKPEKLGIGNTGLKKYGLIFIFILIAISAVVYVAGLNDNKSMSPIASKPRDTSATLLASEPPEIQRQLQNAKQFLTEGKLPEAFIILSSLSKQQIPEAMYYYGKLALQNKNANISCAEAFDLLKQSSDKGYTPAKRTLGFLYSFADNKIELSHAGYGERCLFSKNVSKGSVLLMEATLLGDTAASRFLDTLNSIQ
jgi:serine/threonine-protein kinase